MAAMVFLFTLATSSIGNAPQILILPITEAHGWNISDVSLATGLMYFMTALLCPIGAPLMLRIGVINVVLIVILLEIVGLVCTVLAYEKWHLLFSIGLCLGIASGIIGLGLAATVATRWFTARRGLVVGIMTSAFAAGQLIFMPLILTRVWLLLLPLVNTDDNCPNPPLLLVSIARISLKRLDKFLG